MRKMPRNSLSKARAVLARAGSDQPASAIGRSMAAVTADSGTR